MRSFFKPEIKDESNRVYTKFPNIVKNRAMINELPRDDWSVDEIYSFVSNLSSMTIGQDEMDSYFNKLKGAEKEKFIELFGVEENAPRFTM